MKKYLFFAALAVVVFVGFSVANPSLAAMAGGSQNQAIIDQINSLLLQVRLLQQQLGSTNNPGSQSDSVPLVSPPGSQPGSIKPSSGFSVGDRVRANEKIRVRVSPGSEIVATLLGGETGAVIEASRWSGNYWWVNVRWDGGVSGWSAEDWISKTAQVPGVSSCGDINADGVVNQADVTALVNHIFSGASVPAGVNPDLNGDGQSDVFDQIALSDYLGGKVAAPTCGQPVTMSLSCGDLNRDGKVNGLDSKYLTNHIYSGGSLPAGVSGDLNGDGVPDTFDLIALNDYLAGAKSAPTCQAPTPPQKLPVVPQPASPISPATQSVTNLPIIISACGDVNADGVINTADVTSIVSYTYKSVPVPVGVNADLNGDGVLNYFDQTILSDYLGGTGALPTCGVPATMSLRCGDLNRDGKVDRLDSKYLQSHIYNGYGLPSGVSGDLNGDGVPDTFDLIALNDYLAGAKTAPTCQAPTPPQRMPVVPQPAPTGVPGGQTLSSVPIIIPACGDVNADGVINSTDLKTLISYLFSGGSIPAGVNADLNGDGRPDVFDQIALSDYLGGTGSAPTCTPPQKFPVVPPKTALPTGASAIGSFSSQLDSITILLNQLLDQVGR